MEWRYSYNSSWISFKEQIPDLTGNKEVVVRVRATGVYLPSDELIYSFTEDNQLNTQKYISIDKLSVFQVSSEEPGHNEQAQNAIDGNINTIWHSSWNGDDSERYIIIKLDEPKYLSALQYVPRQFGNNGRIKDGKIFVSMDGRDWIEAATIANWADNSEAKMVVFNESFNSQYIKLVATENYGDGRDFITAAMINLFEDVTNKEEIETPTPDEEEKPEEKPEETPTPDEEEKPEEKPEETPTPDEEEKPEEKPEEIPIPDEEEKPEEKPEETPIPDEEEKPEEKPEEISTPDGDQKLEIIQTEISVIDEEQEAEMELNGIPDLNEEQIPEETSSEIQKQNEEPKIEEILTQNQGHISNANEPDITVTTETLQKTGTNNVISIIIVAIGILVVLYLKTRKNLFRNSKNL